ncbi:MAG: hypothetical protein Q9219_000202 [cf. Caloplaca sp. 3 TL-2023]
MSSRALRKLQREQEKQKELKKSDNTSEDDASEEEGPSEKKRLNAFDMLNEAEGELSDDGDDMQNNESTKFHAAQETTGKGMESQNQTLPKSNPKSSKKKKAKKKSGHGIRSKNDPENRDLQEKSAGLDEIDIALKSLSAKSSNPEVPPIISSSSESFPEMYRLLAIDSKNLNAANEMKRLFGNVVLEGENVEPGPARRRGRDQRLDLGSAFAGRNSPASRGQGLAGLALRRNVFIAGKEEWPKATSGGLGMELVEKLNDGTIEYRFIHSPPYQDVQGQFETCVESLDPHRMIRLLQFNPYHISTLLQVSEIAKQQGDSAVSGDLLERALFSFGRSVHSSFVIALSEGKARLDFRRPENREFWLAAWRYVGNLGQRGTWRTSYEWAKLLLSLDPEGDPYCVAMNLDQLALRGGQADHFLKLCKCSPLDQLLKRPNLRISAALAKYRVKDPKGSRSQLREAIAEFPYIFASLYQELNLEHTPKSIWGQTPRTNRERFECDLYVHNAKDLWNTPEAISILVEVAESVEHRPAVPTMDQDITLDEARHILLSGTPALIDLLPRTFTNMRTTSSDPLPPTDDLPSYSSATGMDVSRIREVSDRQQDAAVDSDVADDANDNPNEVRELNFLQNFFSRFSTGPELVIGDGALQRAATESEVPEEVVVQRGNRLVQLWHRITGANSAGAPLSHDQDTTEPPNMTRPGSASSEEHDSDEGRHLEPLDDGPIANINEGQPGSASQAPSTSQDEPYDDEKNQRWLAGRGMIGLRDFTARHGTDETGWGTRTQEGEALVSEYAARVRQLHQQRTRDFIVNYPLRQGTSIEVRNLVNRYITKYHGT